VRSAASGAVVDAFGAEASRLSEVLAAVAEADFARSSPCPPWTVLELLCHVRIGAGRVAGMLAEPEPSPDPLVPAPGYYRPDDRFSAAVDRDRVEAAQRAASGLTGRAAAQAFGQAWRDALVLAERAPQERVVLTRHGDRMLLTEFLRTRVLELAVHGLDLAAGLGRPPWITDRAATVVQDLMLPGQAAAALRRESGWDQVTLIAKATGRSPVTPADAALMESHGLRRLALG
jgi:uncharacterized protein (TIGR03083 family)